MTHSANEIEALAAKAARGAGAHPAQAAAFGKAAAHHIAANRADTDLIEALTALPDGPIQTLPFAPGEGPLGQSYRDRTPLPARLTPSKNLLTAFAQRAQNTYVPSSESSRASGAGAGLTDND